MTRIGARVTIEVPYLYYDGDDAEEREVVYRVSLVFDSAPDIRPGWFLESIEPPPPNTFVADRLHEDAAHRADTAIDDALDYVGRVH